MLRRTTALLLFAGVACGSAAGFWLWSGATEPQAPAELPVPPFPPRITQGQDYESCLAALSGDPAGAAAMAEAWRTNGGGDGAIHCRALALIALGRPADGAAQLEDLGRTSVAPALGRASLLGQAAQARLMTGDAGRAVEDATQALDLAPDDIDLFILRAQAEAMLDRNQEAAGDLTEALQRDPARQEALVARAVAWRKLGRLDLAQADVAQALSLNPDDADALLERGILRQRTGDAAGARQDWERARDLDPNSTTADLAQQNLSLLDAGPEAQ